MTSKRIAYDFLLLAVLTGSFLWLFGCSTYFRSKNCLALGERVLKTSFQELPVGGVNYLRLLGEDGRLYDLNIDNKGEITTKKLPVEDFSYATGKEMYESEKSNYESRLRNYIPIVDTPDALVCDTPSHIISEDKGKIRWRAK